VNILPLIEAYGREFEAVNHVVLSDAAWLRLKQLEADIQALHWEAVKEIRDAYEDRLKDCREGTQTP
jgi:hypothetical protein